MVSRLRIWLYCLSCLGVLLGHLVEGNFYYELFELYCKGCCHKNITVSMELGAKISDLPWLTLQPWIIIIAMEFGPNVYLVCDWTESTKFHYWMAYHGIIYLSSSISLFQRNCSVTPPSRTKRKKKTSCEQKSKNKYSPYLMGTTGKMSNEIYLYPFAPCLHIATLQLCMYCIFDFMRKQGCS